MTQMITLTPVERETIALRPVDATEIVLDGVAGVPGIRGAPGPKGDTGAQGPQGDVGPEGDTGPQGQTGDTGSSAYQAALDGGFSGTEAEWLASLVGPQGVKGDEGQQGPQGPQGDDGAAATVSVGATTTLSPGTSATVTNTGTSGAAILEFGVPNGAKGDTGPAGTTSWTGLTDKPTTVSGYGITDAYTKTEQDARYLLKTDQVSGSDSNGEWIRFGDGTQICRKAVTLTFTDDEKLEGAWTFSKAFSALPMVFANVDYDNYSATPRDISIGMVGATGISAADCTPHMRRIASTTGFLSGDNAVLFVEAIGRWE